MQTVMEKISDFLGSRTAKFFFLSFVLMFVGLFFMNEYQRGESAVCNGAKFVIERNIDIEYNLRKNGDIEGANKLHKSLVNLANLADDCEFNLLKLLKRRHG
jgi:hypothetical protein